MQLTGAEIVIRCLQDEGVEYVFGYPGGAVLNIYDEFFKQDRVKHVLVRHEQGAAHAADGYSRASHKVGVDRKSTRLNSSHGYISYAVFCLKKKKIRALWDSPAQSKSASSRRRYTSHCQ